MTPFRNMLLAASAALALAPGAASAQSTVSYSYDVLGRLIGVYHPSGASTVYSHDAADNRTHLTTNTSSPTGLAAANQTATIAAGETVALSVASSATNPTNTPLTVTEVDPPAKGTATASGGVITYTAASGQSGADRFRYTLADGRGGKSTAFVTVTIGTACAAPAPQSSSAVVAYGSLSNALPLNLGGAAADGLVLATRPTHGTASVDGAALSYTPKSGYAGDDSLVFRAIGCGATSAPATVNITVASQGMPTAGAASLTVATNTPGAVSLAPGGTWTSLAIASPPSHGTVSLSETTAVYQPETGYAGADSFTYTAAGPGGVSAPGPVSIIVGAPGQLSATLSQNTYVATSSAVGTAASRLTVSASGGSGGYTYAWTKVAGDGAAINDPTSSAVQWTRLAAATGGPLTSTWRCTVTDSNGTAVATGNVSVTVQ